MKLDYRYIWNGRYSAQTVIRSRFQHWLRARVKPPGIRRQPTVGQAWLQSLSRRTPMQNETPGKPAPPNPRLRNTPQPKPLDLESLPHRPRRGTVPHTMKNVAFCLDAHEISGRYDVIRRKLVFVARLWKSAPDDADNVALVNISPAESARRCPRAPPPAA